VPVQAQMRRVRNFMMDMLSQKVLGCLLNLGTKCNIDSQVPSGTTEPPGSKAACR
jgi:hypothetical protein